MTNGVIEGIPGRYEFETEEVTLSVKVQDMAGPLCEWLCPDQVLELLAQTYERQGEDSLPENSLAEFIGKLRLLRDDAKESQDRGLRRWAEKE